MTSVVEIRFKGNRKEYFTWPSAEPPPAPPAPPPPLRLGDPVIVEAERGGGRRGGGQDFGRVSAVGDVAAKKCDRCGACGLTPRPPLRDAERASEDLALRRVLRRATPDDVRQADELHGADDDARRTVRERVRRHALPMKVSDAEWQWDRRKLTVYFTADERVDFRALVRDLAAHFRTRIELRQIGARDEARRLDGIGRCGRQLCISSWLPEARPVSLAVAKDQHLSLNPAQISGPCGRLLCCLRYEHEFYVESRKRFPKEGKTLRTAVGVERVLAVDIFRDRVTLRAEEGNTRVVPLEQLKQELDTAGA